MKTISIKSRIGPDGILKLKIPTTEKEVDVEVIVIMQSKTEGKTSWPGGFLDATYGCLRNNPLERLPQGNYPYRDRLA